LSQHQPASYRLHVEGAGPEDNYESRFDPASLALPDPRPPLKRPYFFPIISSNVLAQVLLKRSKGHIDGFIVEGHMAGGHNAPPRSRKELTSEGEPIYGEQDEVDLDKMRALDLPFYLAGSYAGPGALRRAVLEGAQGIQVGSLFALSSESGMRADLKRE